MDIKKDILWRIYLVYFLVCLFGAAVIAQIVRLQFFQGNYWRAMSDSLTIEYKRIDALRGNILDTDGSLLAASIPVYELRMDVNTEALTDEQFEKNIDSLAFYLSDLFKDRTKKEYKRSLMNARERGERYYLLQRDVNYDKLKKVKTFPLFRLGRYKGGLIVIEKSNRKKPFGYLAARTIGYDIDSVKPVGLEGAYSSYLRGKSGKQLARKLAGGVWMPVNDENDLEPQDGSDIISTIDIHLQDVAENALLTQLWKHKADHGCAVLMEVKTGAIKAIANLARKDTAGGYEESFNYAIGESTEPGSTFKLISLVAAMEDGYVKPNDMVDLENGTHRYHDKIMKDSHAPEEKKVSAQRAFELSSNVGISKLIERSYAKNQQKFVDGIFRMGLDDALGIDISGEEKPKIKTTSDKSWSGVTLPWMSIGYEICLTPLQILTFYNAIANNGTMVKPMFVKEIRHKGKLMKSFSSVILNESVCSPATVSKAKKLLEGVVENGTAKNLKNTIYKIAGKTGTAQVGYADKSKKISYQASFVGYFPADDPQYSCIVMIYSPSNDVYYGNVVAGPVFREIADKVYATHFEMHKELDIQTADAAGAVPYILRDSPKEMKKGTVPNVVGMGLRNAIYCLENSGFSVKVKGKGMVTKQSVEAGTKAEPGMQVVIELS